MSDVRSSFGDPYSFWPGGVWVTPTDCRRRVSPYVDEPGPLLSAWLDEADEGLWPVPGALQAQRARPAAVADLVD